MTITVKRVDLRPNDVIIVGSGEKSTVAEIAPLNRSFKVESEGKRYQANYIYFTDNSYMLASSADTFEVINRHKEN